MDRTELKTKDIVKHIDQLGKNLSKWEIAFIASLIDNMPDKFTKKQTEVIHRIYDTKC